MRYLIGITLFLVYSSTYAQRLALDMSSDQSKSPWLACQHFDEQSNHFDYLCRNNNETIDSRPIHKSKLEEFQAITYEVKKNELYGAVKEVALDAINVQINKIQAYIKCLDTTKMINKVTLAQSTGSKSIDCRNLKFQLISEVNDDLPKFRVFSALRGNSKYKHIYHSELNFGRNRSLSSLNLHEKRLNEIYKDTPLNSQQMMMYLEASELFTTVPKHDIRDRSLPSIPLTPKEVKLALNTYKMTATSSSDNSIEDNEQKWLAEVANNPDSQFHKCVIKLDKGPSQFRFPSYHLSEERGLAKECGNDYFDRPLYTGTLGLGDVTGQKYKISKASAFYSYLSKSNPLRTTHGANFQIHKKWNNNYKQLLSANPYFAYLQLTSEDLLDESDMSNESVLDEKIKNISNKLHTSFTKLLEGVIKAKKSIIAKDKLRDFVALDALIPKYLESKKPLYKSDCDVLGREYRISKRNSAIVDGGLLALSIAGGIACPFTFGVGCAVTVGSEIAGIARTQNQMRLTENQFLAGNSTLDQYLKARQKANQTLAMAPLSVIGLPVLSSTVKGTKLFAKLGGKSRPSQIKSPGRQPQRAQAIEEARRLADEFPTKETRSKFFNGAEAIEHVRVIESIDDQVRFILRMVPEADPAQIRFLLQQGKDKNIRVVFGGSRVRGAGHYKPTSDLDVGFHSTERGTRNLEKIVQKVVKEANKKESFANGLQIEDGVKIYTQNQTPTISAIESPEAFFMRSGVRQAPDPKAGQAFEPSGYVSVSPNGEVIRGTPVTP